MDKCPDCGKFERLYDNVEVCRQCGLGRTTSALTPDDAQNYITGAAFDPEVSDWRRRSFLHLHRKYLRPRPRGKSLDVGCGRGQFVEILLEAGWDAYGLDAYREPRENRRYMRGTLASIDTNASYDLVSMIHSLEHMVNPALMLERAWKILRPNGLLLVVVPNFAGQWSVNCGPDWHMLNTQEHSFHYTDRALRRLLENAGFRVRSSDTHSGYAPSSWQQQLGRNGFYERGWGSIRPIRSLVFRANVAARPILNFFLDVTKRGAEIIALAEKAGSQMESKR